MSMFIAFAKKACKWEVNWATIHIQQLPGTAVLPLECGFLACTDNKAFSQIVKAQPILYVVCGFVSMQVHVLIPW